MHFSLAENSSKFWGCTYEPKMKSKKNEDAVKRVLIDAILDRHKAHNRTQRRLQNIGMRVAANALGIA